MFQTATKPEKLDTVLLEKNFKKEHNPQIQFTS